MKQKIRLMLLFLFINSISWEQNQISITQYMLHHSILNPAATGNSNVINGAAFYRNQWTGMKGAPITTGININIPFGKKNIAVGGMLLDDRIGVNRQTEVIAQVAYKLRFDKRNSLALGISGMAIMSQSDFLSLKKQDGNDPIFNSNTPLFIQPNARFGLYYTSSGKGYSKDETKPGSYYIGLSVSEILQNSIEYLNSYESKVKFDLRGFHYYLQSGYIIKLNNHIAIPLSVLIKQVYGSPISMDINSQVVYASKFGVGISLRSSREVIGLLTCNITPMIKIGYSYDYNWGGVRLASGGTHEIMLILQQSKNSHVIEIPRF